MSTSVRARAKTLPTEAETSAASGGCVLVVDDDATIRTLLTQALEDAGHEVLCVEDGQGALETLQARNVDVVLLDLNLPKVSGLNVLSALPSLHTDAKFIVMTAFGTVESAVEAMKLGAHDYLRKPFAEDEMLHLVDRALAELAVRRELTRLREVSPDRGLPAIVGRTPAIMHLFKLIQRVAPTRATVLITGETGTGKELVARAIHDLSPRTNKAFVPVNCSAIPSTLLEAELFGHTRGSFTGAFQSRKGLIEEASGGTLFLDEISTLSHEVQVKLLRVIEERRVQRVGSNASAPVDFRLVAATNTDLAQMVADEEFREDLFFRLDVFPVPVPPLRDRRDDIVILVNHFLAQFSEEHGVEPPRLSAPTLSRMMTYDWPGNVRELENFIERSVIMSPGADGFPFDLPRRTPSNEGGELLGRAAEGEWTLDRLEREYILSTLERHRWQQGVAADVLGINRRTVHRKLKRYREKGLLPEVPTD